MPPRRYCSRSNPPTAGCRASAPHQAEGGGLTHLARAWAKREKWTLRPGEALTSDGASRRPAGGVVSGQRHRATLLCAVQVRYFQNKEGAWLPHYVMVDEPLVMRKGERWLPGAALRGGNAGGPDQRHPAERRRLLFHA